MFRYNRMSRWIKLYIFNMLIYSDIGVSSLSVPDKKETPIRNVTIVTLDLINYIIILRNYFFVFTRFLCIPFVNTSVTCTIYWFTNHVCGWLCDSADKWKYKKLFLIRNYFIIGRNVVVIFFAWNFFESNFFILVFNSLNIKSNGYPLFKRIWMHISKHILFIKLKVW